LSTSPKTEDARLEEDPKELDANQQQINKSNGCVMYRGVITLSESIERPRSHVLEELSKVAFQKAIPAEWVIRPQIPDYSIDLQVQIFTAKKATVFFFAVQLKSSDTRKSYSHPFETKHLRFYLDCGFPVMLVVYFAESNKLLYDWVHLLYDKLPPDEKHKWVYQETYSISFSKELAVDKQDLITKDVINQYYHLGYPSDKFTAFRIHFDSFETETGRNAILDSIQKWLTENGANEFVSLVSKDKYDCCFTIKQNPKRLSMEAWDTNIEIPLNDSDADTEHLCKLTILLALSICGRSDSAMDLLFQLLNSTTTIPIPSQFLLIQPSLGEMYSKAGREAEALLLAEELTKKGNPFVGVSFATACMRNRKKRSFFGQRFRSILELAIETTSDQKAKGSLVYNMANHLRSTSSFREALRCYRKATKLNSSYKKVSYLWAEAGGCLFECGKFRFSEYFYRKSVSMGETWLPAQALLADAILFQRRYKDALDAFSVYLKDTKKPIAQFVLKHWLCEEFISREMPSRRNSQEAQAITAAAIKISDSNKRLSMLEKAIFTDPFSGFAWFNYSVAITALKKEKRYCEWLITAILQPWDVEAWAWACILLLTDTSAHERLFFWAAMSEAVTTHGQSIANEIRVTLKKIPSLDKETFKAFLALMAEINKERLKYFSQSKDDFIFRLSPGILES